MKQYLKPSMSILSCESLSAKLQGSGAALICSGSECGGTLGAACEPYQSYYGEYVAITLVEKGVTCPVVAAPSCAVTALTINGTSASVGMCYVDDYKQCDTGCGIRIICDSMYLCSSISENVVSATVSCSGFSEPINCITPE